jgi:endoglucanase
LSRYFARALVTLAVLPFLVPPAWCQQGQWPFWDKYAARFIDAQGRVIDGSEHDRTTSESQAYGMFFALVADDRQHFDGMLKWTSDNLAGGDLHRQLPAWKWGQRPDRKWGVLDSNSASDADLWMAYSLLEAGRLWHEKSYRELGLSLLDRIGAEEVADLPGSGPMLLPGKFGFHPTPVEWIINPSYVPDPVLKAAAKARPHGPWRGIREGLQTLICQGSGSNFAMDWDTFTTGKGYAPAVPPQNATNSPVSGSYDAIRVYLWTGLSQDKNSDFQRILGCINGMAKYLDEHTTPPEVVDSTGKAVQPEGSIGFSAALLPYLQLQHRPTAFEAQRVRLESHKDEALGLYGVTPRYYDQNLALFALGWSDHRLAFDSDGKLRVRWIHAN